MYTFQNIYYKNLNESQQNVYRDLVDGLRNLQYEFKFNVSFSDDEILEIFNAINCGCPDIFYIDNRIEYYRRGKELNIKFETLFDKEIIQSMRGRIDEETNRIIGRINKESSDYRKLYLLNTYICEKVSYSSSLNSINGTIYGALVNNVARCEGIAKAATYILWKLNIVAYVITGVANGEEHAWNIIKYNDKLYHFDFTWNLGITHNQKIPGITYMFLDDKTIMLDHKINIKLRPKCSDTSLIYWNKYNCIYYDDNSFINVRIGNIKHYSYVLMKFDDNTTNDFIDNNISRWMMIIGRQINQGSSYKYYFDNKLKTLSIWIE